MEKEMKAIILAAGKGSRVTELCTSLPKCLLPVGNEPLIFYPLRMLQKAGFKDVLIVVADIYQDAIQKTLANRFPMQIEYFDIPYNKDLATADSLRLVASKKRINEDVLVISCDVVIDFDLLKLINFYRTHNPTLTAVVSTSQIVTESSVPGRKGKGKLERDLIAVASNGKHRLLFLSAEADFDDEVTLHKAILRKCPEFEIRSDFLDAHIYVIKKWVLNFLLENTQISSIKGELIPDLIRKQFKKVKHETKEGIRAGAPSSVDCKTHISEHFEGDDISKALLRLQPGYEKGENVEPKIECLAYLLHNQFCVRSNNILSYVEANKQLPRNMIEHSVTPSTPTSKAQIGPDCIIGKDTVFGDRCAVKKTVIGRNCNIQGKVKLVNCVVMDNVEIEENCSIQGSIICSGVHIGHSSEIKDCVIASKQNVVAFAKFSNEVIMDVEHMMQL
ncbi:translation initiation factor eIF-2B subunit gamma-like protein [Leptotrombidium deliense]|uniref:Translation initiation factor eIF2B subunit gamma n=1 Tax=Leptotrombidium deliense TaxID=299467 RepID=A0A443SH91_9ACAR|nr:translation initiation factor eIF-2B subunit gamma-like protein [Leptotrombidium deliense]